MNYEKKYKEALERARKLYEQGTITESLCYVFPELKESEDKKIRKALFEYFTTSDNNAYYEVCGVATKKILAWLEKQKPFDYEDANIQQRDFAPKSALEAIKEEKVDNANKVEPKFKVGDWVIWQDKCYKVNNNGCRYELVDQNGLSTSLEYGTIDKNAHLWDITKDAKDGDVLVSESQCGLDTWYCIFKSLDDDESMTVYCYLARDGRFETIKELCFDKDPSDVKPANKEQRDLLFQKMKEAGYEWDSNKLMLMKILPCDNISNGVNVDKQKPAEWSEEELAQAKKDAFNDALDKIGYHSGEPTFDDGWSAAIDFMNLE